MLKEIAFAYVSKKVIELIRKHGMKLVLQALVEFTKDQKEDYLQQLHRDLKTALENYENRYKQ